MDKNGWMNKAYKIMGFERTDKAREASNIERERKIASLSRYKVYKNPVAKKPKENLPSLSLLGEKAKTREKRFKFLEEQKEKLKLQRELIETQDKSLEAESMTNRMASTLNDKDWRSTMTTIRDRYNRSEASHRLQGHSVELEVLNKDNDEKDELQEWFNTTCNSNANRWRYRKPKKMDTDS